MEGEALFLSDSPVAEETEQLTALTIQDFGIPEHVGIGMTVSGTALIVSLLVLGILSILRIR